MKKTALLPIVLLLVCCGRPTSQNALQSNIDSLCRKWVPVTAESICSAELIMMSDKSFVIKGETNISEAKTEILSYLDNSGVKYTDSLNVLPDSSVGDKCWGIVTLSVINIRDSQSQAAEMINQALMGTPVKILKRDGSWYLIQTPDMYIGWAEDDAVSLRTEAELAGWKNSERIIYTGKWGDVYNIKNDGTVSDIVFGSVLQVTGKGILKYDVVLPDGRQGSVRKSEAVDFRQWAERKVMDAAEMTDFGRTFLGIPYLWGGISHKGIDCSGFAKACYFSSAMIITRDASSQFLYGEEVDVSKSIDALQPGDLLFFGRDNNGVKSITHVGMYIGDTEVIHSSGLVKINSLDPSRDNYSEYLKSRLQGVRRFLGAPYSQGLMSVRQHNWYF